MKIKQLGAVLAVVCVLTGIVFVMVLGIDAVRFMLFLVAVMGVVTMNATRVHRAQDRQRAAAAAARKRPVSAPVRRDRDEQRPTREIVVQLPQRRVKPPRPPRVSRRERQQVEAFGRKVRAARETAVLAKRFDLPNPTIADHVRHLKSLEQPSS